ncbi:uncharacterized protein DNG_09119 [Cephalotrichum gorgonifer]|uniref:Zn(2)-C6 fungal-type domain-containing protein n=1 Tax=Cephalotrichum gorgonifer TaxID=2041049 RepID=A0AAE8N6B0_9PEZI|nr:uncharacterized protein DNG_09119 [Cephalotrichum gorgonifer]
MATTTRRPACDRCFHIKVRCARLESDGALSRTCQRCARLGFSCTTQRQKPAVGRPRKPDRASKKPQPAAEFVWDASLVLTPPASETSQQLQAGGAAEASETWYLAKTAETAANLRLSGKSEPSESPLTLRPLALRASSPLLSRLRPRDSALLGVMFDKPTFIYNFLLGAQHADRVLSHLFATLVTSPEIVLSSFLATAGRLARRLRLIPSSDANLDYVNSAKAVQILRRTTPITSLSKTELWSMTTLGTGILTFDLLDSGLNAHSISRNTLVLVDQYFGLSKSPQHPVQGAAAFLDELGPTLIPLVLMDTYNCIIRRQIPVFNFRLPCIKDLDGYIGLCRPLLPLLFNICCISQKLARLSTDVPGAGHVPAEDDTLKRELEEELDAAEFTLLLWNPSVPDRFRSCLSVQETGILELQAKIYVQAVLLVIHRLRYPFGREDNHALVMSNSIRAGIEQILAIPTPSTSGGVDEGAGSHGRSRFDYRLFFPLFVAAVEITDSESRDAMIQTLHRIIFVQLYEEITTMAVEALAYFWRGGICDDRGVDDDSSLDDEAVLLAVYLGAHIG